MTNGINDKPRADFAPYVRAWCDKMVEIWRDRIDLLGASPHGNLRASVKAGPRTIEGLGATVAFEFVRYGLYVDSGVGRGYKPGEDGKIKLRDRVYRQQRGLGKERVPRPWFSKSWFISVQVIKNHLTSTVAQYFVSTAEALAQNNKK